LEVRAARSTGEGWWLEMLCREVTESRALPEAGSESVRDLVSWGVVEAGIWNWLDSLMAAMQLLRFCLAWERQKRQVRMRRMSRMRRLGISLLREESVTLK